MVFPVVMYRCESWTIKKADVFKLWCWKRPLRVPCTAKIKPINPKRKSTLNTHWKDWSWSSNIWPPDVNSQLIGKDPDAGKDWRQKDKRVTDNEIVGWYHWFNGHELGQTLGDGEEQRPGMLQSMGVAKSQTWLGDWTTNNNIRIWNYLTHKKTYDSKTWGSSHWDSPHCAYWVCIFLNNLTFAFSLACSWIILYLRTLIWQYILRIPAGPRMWHFPLQQHLLWQPQQGPQRA